jgi:protein-L-isoaspartate(D-aspartate) O-methyltransferase
VVSIERRPALVARARATLGRLGCVNVTVLEGDGSDGVPVFSPYDAVLVAAGAPRVPTDLTAQLADGGRLVVPVGTAELQHLMVLRRTGERVTEEVREDCVFVPLVGRQGWSVEHPAAK